MEGREEGRREREGWLEVRDDGRGGRALAKLDSRFLNKTILNRQKKRCKLGALVTMGLEQINCASCVWNVAVIKCRRSRGFKQNEWQHTTWQATRNMLSDISLILNK